MSDKKELVLEVPAELTRRCKGLAIDFGGSGFKVVYRTKEDMDEVAAEDATCGHLHLAMFARSQLTEALEYISQRAVITRTMADHMPTIYTTGLGCTEFGRPICDKMNVKLEQISEFDCFVKSFVYLTSRLPRHQLVESFLEEATAEPIEYIGSQVVAFQEACQSNQMQTVNQFDTEQFRKLMDGAVGRPSPEALSAGDVPMSAAETDMFPCMLVVCGSANVYMKVERDGSFKISDGTTRGGKSFLGIGTFLTNCKSFDELVDLASKGNPKTVDQYSDELFESRDSVVDEDSLYRKSEHMKPGVVFNFGRAVGSSLGKFRGEDVARAWLNYCAVDLVQTSQWICLLNGVKRLFFCGGFTSHPLVRGVITQEYVRRNLLRLMLGTPGTVHFDFVKPGPYLGALGCAINDIEKFIGK